VGSPVPAVDRVLAGSGTGSGFGVMAADSCGFDADFAL